MIPLKICIKDKQNLFIEGSLNVPLTNIDYIDLNAKSDIKLQNAVCIHTKDDHNWLFVNQHADIIRKFLVDNKLNIKIRE